MMGSTEQAAITYFEAWRTHDFDRLRTVLADHVEFTGPLGTAKGVDECLAGLRGIAQRVMVDLVVHARVVEGADAITWFDLVTANTPPLPTANWSHLEDGRIVQIRATFDPRPLLTDHE